MPITRGLFTIDEVYATLSEIIGGEKQAGKAGWDKATDKFSYPESVKFTIYQAPPSFMGLYIGYAPK